MAPAPPDVGWEHFARGMHEAVCVGDSLKDVACKCVEVAKGMDGTISAGRKYKARNKTKELLEAEAELTTRIEDRKLCMDFEEAKKLSRARNLQRKKVRNLQQQRKWEVQCMQNRRPQQLSLGEFEGSKDLEEWGGLLQEQCSETLSDGLGRDCFLHEEVQLLWAMGEVQNRKGSRPSISVDLIMRTRA